MENQEGLEIQNSQPVDPNQVGTNIALVVFVGLACSLVFGIGGYFLGIKSSKPVQELDQPQVQPTPTLASSVDSEWKTYVNQEFGFSIKYPASAKTSSRDPDPFPVAIQIDDLKPRTGGGGGPEMTGWLIVISEPQKNPDGLSLLDWSKGKNLSVIDQNSPITIDSREAIMWEFSETYRYYLIEKSPTEVVYVMINKGDVTQISSNIFDQILSSLKFVN